MKSILTTLCCLIIFIATSCSSSESSYQYGKIELLKIDSKKVSVKSKVPAISPRFKFIDASCIPHFPKFKMSIAHFELLDSNKQIILAKLVGGDEALTLIIDYPELAKRSDIEGKVWIEFKVDKRGNTSELKILKDIGGGCGAQVIKAVSKAKFYPGKLLNKDIESWYRMAIQFKIIPISKKEEEELRQKLN